MIKELIGPALGAVAGAIAGYVAWWWQSRRQLEISRDDWLHAQRFKLYRRLWSALEPLALFSPPASVDYACLAEMSKKLRQWYFTGGGLVMTPHTRDVYFLVQETLVRATAANKGGAMLRDANDILTLDDMDGRRRELKIPGLDPASAASGDQNGAQRQVGQVRRMLNESWKFTDPPNDYVLLQYLTSTLRTTVTVELQSRALPLQSKSAVPNEF